MRAFLLKRLQQGVITLLLVSIITFAITMLLPGDPARAFLGEAQGLDPVAYQAMRNDLGLDQPLPVQYVRWLERAVRGDFGRSVRTKELVLDGLLARLPVTLQLIAMSVVIGLLIAVPVGIISAVRPNSPLDIAGTVLSVSGMAIPSFWLGIMLIYVFSLWLRWLPSSGYVSPTENLVLSLRSMLLPAFVLGLDASASLMRQIRSSLIEVIHQEYIVTATAKGLSERSVIRRHALQNAMIPVVTILGLQIGRLFGGSVIIEQIFALPGLGRWSADSIFFRDLPSLQGVILFLAVAVLISNLLADLAYMVLDPRIRVS